MTEEKSLFIEGFSIHGYRSFGKKPQLIGPLNKINVFIGPNNSGKSNVLRYINEEFGKVRADILKDAYPTANYVKHRDFGTGPIEAYYGMVPDGPRFNSRMASHRGVTADFTQLVEFMRLAQQKVGLSDNDVVWFEHSQRGGQFSKTYSNDFIRGIYDSSGRTDTLRNNFWLPFAQRLGRQSANRNHDQAGMWVITDVLWFLDPVSINPVAVEFIPEHRKLEGDLIARLHDLQSPDHTNRKAFRDQFEAIRNFVCSVLEKEDVELSIPRDGKSLEVFINGKYFPINDLGTGIHETIIIASLCTLKTKQIICIEEPELHLHPQLQRQLLRYLATETSNQYFVTTHSAHIIDTPNAEVFRVKLEEKETTVVRAGTNDDRRQITNLLGYRASDILQSNSIVWVEGPSDAIYLRRWLKEADSELFEGVHYSLLCYGGNALKHLTATDNTEAFEGDEDDQWNPERALISLKRINQWVALVMDSDDELNESKDAGKTAKSKEFRRRIREEISKENGLCWMTLGLEVENYVPQDVIDEEIKNLYPKSRGRNDACARVFQYVGASGAVQAADKIDLAERVVNRAFADLDVLDLRSRLEGLSTFIRSANGMRVKYSTEPPVEECTCLAHCIRKPT